MYVTFNELVVHGATAAGVYERAKVSINFDTLAEAINSIMEDSRTTVKTMPGKLRRMNGLNGKNLKSFLEGWILKKGDEVDRQSSDETGASALTLGAEGGAKFLYRKAIQDLIEEKEKAGRSRSEIKSTEEKEKALTIANSVKALQAQTTAAKAGGGGSGPSPKQSANKMDKLLDYQASKDESKGRMMGALTGAIAGLGSPNSSASPEELAASKKRKVDREEEMVRNIKAKTEALQSKTSLANAKAAAEADRVKTAQLEAETAKAAAEALSEREMILAKAKADAMRIDAEARREDAQAKTKAAEAQVESAKAQVEMNKVLALLLGKMT